MHPNSNRLTYDVALGNLTPYATIAAVVSIITHHEVVPWPHDDGEIPDGSQLITLDLMTSFLAGFF